MLTKVSAAMRDNDLYTLTSGFDELSTVDGSQVPVGGFVQEPGKQLYWQRADDSASDSDLDYSGASGVKWYVIPGVNGYSPLAWGADGDGVSDDTAYLSAALQRGNVDLTDGTYRWTSTITVPKARRVIYGKGSSDLLFEPSTAPDTGFYLERVDGVNGCLTLDNVDVVTTVADCGQLVSVEETRVAPGGFVVGAYDIVRLVNGTRVLNSGSGYWRNAVRAVNAGGIIIDNVTLANFGNTTAQSNVNTAAIAIINNNSDCSIIRALHWDQSYSQRWQHGVFIDTVSSVESVYLGQGEMVGHSYGVLVDGGGNVGAVHVNGTHMDNITSNFRTQGGTSMNVARFTGADLRLGANGAGVDNLGINVRIDNGNYVSIIGGFLDGDSSATGQRGVVVVNDVPGLIVQANNFRNQSTGVLGSNLTRATLGKNQFENVTTQYDVAVAPGVDVT